MRKGLEIMKAEFNGIKFEGTPEEIARVIQLAGLTKEVKEVVKYVPVWDYQKTWYGEWKPNTAAGTVVDADRYQIHLINTAAANPTYVPFKTISV